MNEISISLLNSSNRSMTDKALTGVGSLIKLLPTGTVFVFQFLSPVVTNNGHCGSTNKYLTGILIGLCGLSCCVSTFTDSSKDSNGKTHYGFVTLRGGLWPAGDSGSADPSRYKLQVGDFVHAFFSLIVFLALVLLDSNTATCFYPASNSASVEKLLLMALPPVIGTVSGSIFMIFPNNRHGIGYPSSDTQHVSIA